jgi:DNA-3-methyladenine glycosylase
VDWLLDRGYRILGMSFYWQPTGIVARSLLGKYLVRFLDGVTLVGRIVETEAYYHGNDPACHAYRGMTKRNEMMFGTSGRAYVYFTYGNHYLLNVVTGKIGKGEAVLIRALEPIEGLEVMRLNRNREKERDLTTGPGKLAQAMAIDLSLNGCDLRKSELVIARREKKQDFKIGRSRRIGISEGKELLERYYIAGNKFVSVSPKD